MIKNISSPDRIFRLTVAVVFAVLYFTHIITGILPVTLLAVAVIFALTALVNFCPIYFAFGIKKWQKKNV